MKRARSRPTAFAALVTATAVLVLLMISQIENDATPALVVADPAETYDPVLAGEPTPDGFRQLVRRDDIEPIYHPTFVSPEEIEWEPDTLIVGVALDGEAKAYPVNFLNIHEMINDRIADTPILVSW